MKRTCRLILIALISFLTGVGIGLGIAWGILPVKSKDTHPALLNQPEKDIYRSFVANSFNLTHDMTRAAIRLELLDGEDALNALEEQVERIPMDQTGAGDRNAVYALYDAMVHSQNSSTPDVISPIITTQTTYLEATRIVAPGNLEIAQGEKLLASTTTPPPKPLNFTIRNRRQVCSSSQQAPLLQVMVFDQSGNPVRGIAILVTSFTGTERILTGLKPEISTGYVDLLLSPGKQYSMIVEGAIGNPEMVSAAECLLLDGGTYPGGWMLEIQL